MKKICYIVTPRNFETWCIYYERQVTPTAQINERLSGYGLEGLKRHLSGGETILRTGSANIKFLMDYNNRDTNGTSEWDINLSNEDYIKEFIKNGAELISL